MINLILGSMFASKSSYLLQKIDRGLIANKKACFCRNPIDTRNFIARNTYKINEDLIFFIKSKEDLEKIFKNFDIICIDEFQFFQYTNKLIELSLEYTNKQIYLAGLNASADQKLFQPIVDILPYVSNIIYTKAVCCKCGSDEATFTINKNKKDLSQPQIGDKDDYIVLCDKCFGIYKRIK